MTKAINIKARVAELSATLPKVEAPYTETAYDEFYGIAEEFVGYNNRYNLYYGIEDWSYEGMFNSCVLQKHGEFQVLRFFQVDTYMSGEGMKRFYINSAEHADDDDWMDNDDEDYYDELEIQDIIEYKQVWIDRFGNTEIVNLQPAFVEDTEAYVKVEGIQPWAKSPIVMNAILDNVSEETSFCHTYNDEPTLEFYLSKSFEYLSASEPVFLDLIKQHYYTKKAISYYNSLRIAHRHGYAFPTDYKTMCRWFSILDFLKAEGERKHKDFLNAPEYICPTDINAVWERCERKRKEMEQKMEIERRIRENEEFNEQHAYLFGIEFDSKTFHYQSLDSIKAYYDEGERMHHCIGKCGYWKNHNHLSLHISDHEGNRVATCTIDVEKRTINQIQPIGNDIGFFHTYGIQWRSTNDYKEIWRTLMGMMHTFPKKVEEQTDEHKALRIA